MFLQWSWSSKLISNFKKSVCSKLSVSSVLCRDHWSMLDKFWFRKNTRSDDHFEKSLLVIQSEDGWFLFSASRVIRELTYFIPHSKKDFWKKFKIKSPYLCSMSSSVCLKLTDTRTQCKHCSILYVLYIVVVAIIVIHIHDNLLLPFKRTLRNYRG